MTVPCARCPKVFDTYSEKVHHEETAMNHWRCQRSSKGDAHCDYVGSSFGSLVTHWNKYQCHQYCEVCKLGHLTRGELDRHIRTTEHEKKKREHEIQRGIINDADSSAPRAPKRTKRPKPKVGLGSVNANRASPPPAQRRPAPISPPRRLTDRVVSRNTPVCPQQQSQGIHQGPSAKSPLPNRSGMASKGPPPRNTNPPLNFRRADPVLGQRENRMTGDGPARKESWSMDQILAVQGQQERFLPRLPESKKARAPTVKIAMPTASLQPPVHEQSGSEEGEIVEANHRPVAKSSTTTKKENIPLAEDLTSSFKKLTIANDSPASVAYQPKGRSEATPSPSVLPKGLPNSKAFEQATSPMSVVTNGSNLTKTQTRPTMPLYTPPNKSTTTSSIGLGSNNYARSSAARADAAGLVRSKWTGSSQPASADQTGLFASKYADPTHQSESERLPPPPFPQPMQSFQPATTQPERNYTPLAKPLVPTSSTTSVSPMNSTTSNDPSRGAKPSAAQDTAITCWSGCGQTFPSFSSLFSHIEEPTTPCGNKMDVLDLRHEIATCDSLAPFRERFIASAAFAEDMKNYVLLERKYKCHPEIWSCPVEGCQIRARSLAGLFEHWEREVKARAGRSGGEEMLREPREAMKALCSVVEYRVENGFL